MKFRHLVRMLIDVFFKGFNCSEELGKLIYTALDVEHPVYKEEAPIHYYFQRGFDLTQS